MIYYGTDPDRFYPATAQERTTTRAALDWPSDRPIVLFVGALSDRRKGFDTVFDAWTILHREHRGEMPMLIVIGRGADMPMWQSRVAAAELSEHIRFLGFRDDVPRLIRAADALVSPTRYESYGLGVHEALCCGLPALVSVDAGVAERYPAALSDLLLPDPNDPRELAQRLRCALERSPAQSPRCTNCRPTCAARMGYDGGGIGHGDFAHAGSFGSAPNHL